MYNWTSCGNTAGFRLLFKGPQTGSTELFGTEGSEPPQSRFRPRQEIQRQQRREISIRAHHNQGTGKKYHVLSSV